MAVGWSSVGLVAAPIPLVEHWNGTTWSIERTPIPATAGWGGAFLAVSCTSRTACVAVGGLYTANSERPLVERWDGSFWSIEPIRHPLGAYQFSGVSCISSTDCVAVGGREAARWGGRHWSAQSIHVGDSHDALGVGLTGVSCLTDTTCAAVGGDDITCAYYYDYTVPILGFWTAARSLVWPEPRLDCSTVTGSVGSHALNAVSCTSTAACTAVGTSIYRWNGRRWSIQPARLGSDDELNGVSCTSASACTAVGPDIYTWNGGASSRMSVPRPNDAVAAWLNGVSCTSPDACVAVGDYQDRASRDLLLIEATER